MGYLWSQLKKGRKRENFNSLKKRNGKYVLKTISTSGETEFSDIYSIQKLIDWSEHRDEAEKILCDPNIEIVTMTVTESGYYISEDNELNLNLKIVDDNINKKKKIL